MKTIGLIGGMAWQSSLEYYRIINEQVSKRLGGQHSCQCAMYSVDLDPILILRDEDDWDRLADIIADAVARVERAGADFSVICSNTMHKTVEKVGKRVSKPILHIGDVTGKAVVESGMKKVGILGTRFTLSQDFYVGRLREKFGLEVVVPDEADIMFVHNVIYEELDFSVLNPASRGECAAIIERLAKKGAEGVILGCTELPLLIKPEDSSLPLFDTTLLHATEAVNWALQE